MSRPPDRPSGDDRRALAGAFVYAAAALLRRGLAWLFAPPPGHQAALFPRWSNAVFLGALAGAGLTGVIVLGVLLWRAKASGHPALVVHAQPVPFSHQIHVTGLRIDCLYCHSTAERAAPAGMPATRTCVPCHNDVWLNSRAFAPVRASLAADRPIPWVRVNDLPDFTFFHHGIHSARGIGCETCHGRVDRMTVARQVAPLTMGWCLDCHRAPERFLRPRSQVTTMGWVPDRPQAELGMALRREYRVAEMTHCSTCHR